MTAATLLALVLSTPALQGSTDSWATVAQLPAGTVLTVDRASGDGQTGRLASADDSGLTLDVRGQPVHVPRAAARRISRHQPRRIGRAARRGFLVGAAFGAGLGGLTAKSNRALWVSLMAVGWGTVTAGASAIIALGPPQTEVVYVAAAGPPTAP
jgi:hypothetical protein